MQKTTFLPEYSSLSHLLKELKQAGLRVTGSRIAILQTLLKNHGPFTAEEIHNQVTKEICDLATIYRSLASLEKVKIIRRCEFGDGSARYELCTQEKHHHHHVICRVCKRVEVLEDCELQEIDRFARKRGFKEVTHFLEFFGTCPQCYHNLE
jgi:Fur family ferric uptake transcriptional regulator